MKHWYYIEAEDNDSIYKSNYFAKSKNKAIDLFNKEHTRKTVIYKIERIS